MASLVSVIGEISFGDVDKYLPPTGLGALLIFVVRLGLWFQNDFTEKYHERVGELSSLIEAKEEEIDSLRRERDECCAEEDRLKWKNRMLLGILEANNIMAPTYLRDEK